VTLHTINFASLQLLQYYNLPSRIPSFDYHTHQTFSIYANLTLVTSIHLVKYVLFTKPFPFHSSSPPLPPPTQTHPLPSSPDSSQEQPDDTDPDAGLTPEEDWVVPGTYQDAQSSKTELGKALRDAIEEVDALGNLEKDMLQQADELLKSMGYKRSLFDIEDGSTSNRSSSSSSSSSSGGGGGDRDGST